MERAWLSACRRIETFFAVYVLFYTIVSVFSGANRTPELHHGYWFGWHWLVGLAYLIPYVTTYSSDVCSDTSMANDYLVRVGVNNIWIRYHVQIVLGMTLLVTNGLFFAFRISDFVGNCGAGTQCDAQTTSYVLYLLCSFMMALCSLGVLIVLVTCPVVSPHVALPRSLATDLPESSAQGVPLTSIAGSSRNAVARSLHLGSPGQDG